MFGNSTRQGSHRGGRAAEQGGRGQGDEPAKRLAATPVLDTDAVSGKGRRGQEEERLFVKALVIVVTARPERVDAIMQSFHVPSAYMFI